MHTAHWRWRRFFRGGAHGPGPASPTTGEPRGLGSQAILVEPSSASKFKPTQASLRTIRQKRRARGPPPSSAPPCWFTVYSVGPSTRYPGTDSISSHTSRKWLAKSAMAGTCSITTTVGRLAATYRRAAVHSRRTSSSLSSERSRLIHEYLLRNSS